MVRIHVGPQQTTERTSAALLSQNRSFTYLKLGTGFVAGDEIMTGTFSWPTTYTGSIDVATGLTTVKSVSIEPSRAGYVLERVGTAGTTFTVELWETTSAGGPLVNPAVGTGLPALSFISGTLMRL